MSAKKGQKFQNKSAFKVKYDTCSLEVTKKASLDRLCKRCLEQIQWKIQFNKYKPAKVPSRWYSKLNNPPKKLISINLLIVIDVVRKIS